MQILIAQKDKTGERKKKKLQEGKSLAKISTKIFGILN